MTKVKINTTINKVNVSTTENKLTITDNNTGTSVNITPTNTGTVTISSPGLAGPTGAPGADGADGSAGDFANLTNVPFLYSSSLQAFTNVTASNNISASNIVIAKTGSFERAETTGDLGVDGDVIVSQYIKHKGDINTAINFTDNKIALEAGGMTFFAVHDDDSAPFTATVNGGSNRINFKAMDKNNDLLLKTDSDEYKVNLYHAGNQKLETHTLGVNVTGNISASGHVTASGNISSSGDITANKLYLDQYIYHAENNITYLNFTKNRLRFNIGGISYIDLNDNTGPPRDITFNDGGNNVDLTIKGSSNNPLFKTDASLNRIGTHGKGSPEAAFHIGGDELRVDGNISASGFISASDAVIGTTGSFSRLQTTGNVKFGSDPNVGVEIRGTTDAASQWPFTVSANGSTAICNFTNAGSSSPSGIYLNFSGAQPNDRTDYYFYATDGGGNDITLYSDGGAKFNSLVEVDGNLKIDGSQVDFTNLPTSDPSVAGRLWNDSGTVKISAG